MAETSQKEKICARTRCWNVFVPDKKHPYQKFCCDNCKKRNYEETNPLIESQRQTRKYWRSKLEKSRKRAEDAYA